MRHFALRSAALIALLSAGAAQAAQAQAAASCLKPAEVRGMVAYVLPSVIEGAARTCAPHLGAQSWLPVKGAALAERLETGRAAAWPQARLAFAKIAGNGQGAGMLDAMPEALLRPLIEQTVSAQLVPSIKPENCGDIDRIAATLEPLPDANIVSLVSEVLSVASRGRSKITACPVQAAQ